VQVQAGRWQIDLNVDVKEALAGDESPTAIRLDILYGAIRGHFQTRRDNDFTKTGAADEAHTNDFSLDRLLLNIGRGVTRHFGRSAKKDFLPREEAIHVLRIKTEH
jgi:hypothetical protein